MPRLLRTKAIVITKRASVNKFSFETANESMVYRLIRKLAITKSVGLDNISTNVLQIAAAAVVKPLTKIFNDSVELD